MDRDAPLLIVATDPKEAVALRSLFPSPTLDASPEAATLMVEASRLGGMVVGITVPLTLSKVLVRSYSKHQPCGRIVVLGRSDDITTLTAFAFHDPRVELFLAPWRMELVRSFLQVEEPCPA